MSTNERWSRRTRVFAVLGLVLVGLAPGHPGGLTLYLAFQLVFPALLLLALSRPRSHFYSALVVLLSLGFWTKYLAHRIVEYDYVEPIGGFDGSAAAWDRAFAFVVAGALGVGAARIVHLVHGRRRKPRTGDTVSSFATPPWYPACRLALWAGFATLVVALYAWNWTAAFQQVGIDARVILPFPFNAALAWWFNMALPMVLTVLLGWELGARRSSDLTLGLLAIPLVEAAAGSFAMLSRSAYYLRMTPYLLAPVRRAVAGGVRLRVAPGRLLVVLAVGAAVSLAATMAGRIVSYEPVIAVPRVDSTPPETADRPTPMKPRAKTPEFTEVPGSQAPLRHQVWFGIHEVSGLFIDRWTGLEGVLAVAGAPERGGELLHRALVEDPARGQDSLYQRIAGADAPSRPGRTFLTLAGVVGLLALSGSVWLVGIGMTLLTLLFVALEEATRRGLPNEMLCAVIGVGSAFVLSQANFPRLLGIFVLELAVTVALLCLSHRLLVGRPEQ